MHNDPAHALITQPDHMALAGVAANRAADTDVWRVYQHELTDNTRRRQMNDLASYCAYLSAAGITRTPEQFYSGPDAWAGTTYGLLAGYVEWSMQHGYAIGTINTRLATLRKYCELVCDGGLLDRDEWLRIKEVKGLVGKPARNRDRERVKQGIPTRLGPKKGKPTNITTAQAHRLKNATTPHARATAIRDAAMMGLMIEHALRCGEIVSLDVECVSLQAGTITFYREKTDKTETHVLKKHTFAALETYLASEQRTTGPLFLGNKGQRLSKRAVNDRVGVLGKQLGVEHLSPHDLRHFWTLDALRNQTPFNAVKSGGGWRSDTMVLRYGAQTGIANAGVVISEEE